MLSGTPSKSFVFSLLILCSILCLSFASSARVQPQQVTSNPARSGIGAMEEQVRVTPEVRLRKLHLVRPDLIPYPVAFEVYC